VRGDMRRYRASVHSPRSRGVSVKAVRVIELCIARSLGLANGFLDSTSQRALPTPHLFGYPAPSPLELCRSAETHAWFSHVSATGLCCQCMPARSGVHDLGS
jgi:hypothetical protein